MIDVVLIDRKPALLRAWAQTFRGTPVRMMPGDFVAGSVGGAWVSPANSFGWMDGGLDWPIRLAYEAVGADITAVVQAAIRQQAGGELPVGQALVIPTPETPYTHLIVAPTMRTPRPAFWTLNAYLAFRAILWTVQQWNAAKAGPAVATVSCPGLATGVGRMPARRCARQMRAAWDQIADSAQPLPPLGRLTTWEQFLRYR